MLWDSWWVCLFLILVFWTEWAVLSQNWHTYRFHLVWVCLFNFKSFSFHKTHLHIWVIEKLIDFFFFTTLNILFLIHKAFHSPYWIKISQGEELTVPTWTKASLMGTIHLNHYFFIFGPLCCTFLFWNKIFPPSKSKLQDFLLHFLLFHAQKQKRLPDGTMKPYWALIARPRQVVGAAVRKSTRFSLKINLRTKKRHQCSTAELLHFFIIQFSPALIQCSQIPAPACLFHLNFWSKPKWYIPSVCSKVQLWLSQYI